MVKALYREDPSAATVTTKQIRRTLETLRSEPTRGTAVVLDVEGTAAGYALLISFWSNELGGEVCHIDEIFVRPHHRGHGYATALIESLIDGRGPWAGRPVALDLEVSPTNCRAAALYERLGFGVPRNRRMRVLLADRSSRIVRE